VVTVEIVYGRRRPSLKVPLAVFGAAVLVVGTVILLEEKYGLAFTTLAIGLGLMFTARLIPPGEVRQACPNCATRIHAAAHVCPQCRLPTGWHHEEAAVATSKPLRVRVREER